MRRSPTSICQAAVTVSAASAGRGRASRWSGANGADCALPRSGCPVPSSCAQSGASPASRRARTRLRNGQHLERHVGEGRVARPHRLLQRLLPRQVEVGDVRRRLARRRGERHRVEGEGEQQIPADRPPRHLRPPPPRQRAEEQPAGEEEEDVDAEDFTAGPRRLTKRTEGSGGGSSEASGRAAEASRGGPEASGPGAEASGGGTGSFRRPAGSFRR